MTAGLRIRRPRLAVRHGRVTASVGRRGPSVSLRLLRGVSFFLRGGR